MRINRKEVEIITACPFCGQAHSVFANERDYLDWQEGELVQNAFPYLSADDREMLISGCCPSCWKKTFEGKIWDGTIGGME